jgi:DNA-binding CsgD family transcriptional regulator
VALLPGRMSPHVERVTRGGSAGVRPPDLRALPPTKQLGFGAEADPDLTDVEREVLGLLLADENTKTIAAQLGIFRHGAAQHFRPC